LLAPLDAARCNRAVLAERRPVLWSCVAVTVIAMTCLVAVPEPPQLLRTSWDEYMTTWTAQREVVRLKLELLDGVEPLPRLCLSLEHISADQARLAVLETELEADSRGLAAAQAVSSSLHHRFRIGRAA
jgi:hypothetical protein